MKHLLFMALLLWGQRAFGQSDTTGMVLLDSLPAKADYEFGIVTEVGVAQVSSRIPNLTSFLKSNQAGRANTVSYQLYTGFGVRIRRIKILAQITIPLSASDESRYKASQKWMVRQQSGSQFGVIAGYDVLNDYNRRIYLFGGAGFTNLDFNVYQRSTQIIPFQSIFQNASLMGIGSLRIQNAPYLDFGLEAAYREKRVRSIQYVIRLGYRVGVKQRAWGSEYYQFIDPIQDKVSQFYGHWVMNWSSNRKPRRKP